MSAMLRRLFLTALLGLCSAAALADAHSDEFFRAIRQDNDAAVRSLLARGFNPNTKDEKGTPGLVVALQEGALRVASLLIDSPRLVPETRNAADESPLMMAALKGHAELARRLIARDADVNKPGWTPLHYAATHKGPNAPAITRLLLEHHAFIDAESPNKTTPLMMAAHYGHPMVVRILLEEGADPMARNEQGLTAIDFAHRAGRTDMAELIASFVRQRQPRGTW